MSVSCHLYPFFAQCFLSVIQAGDHMKKNVTFSLLIQNPGVTRRQTVRERAAI